MYQESGYKQVPTYLYRKIGKKMKGPISLFLIGSKFEYLYKHC